MDNNANYIKMDGEEAAFEGGAIRYTKTGKGRYDLIPGDIVQDVLAYALENTINLRIIRWKHPIWKLLNVHM